MNLKEYEKGIVLFILFLIKKKNQIQSKTTYDTQPNQ